MPPIERVLEGRNFGYVVVLIPALFGIVYSLVEDVFIDENETPATEEFRQKRGIKATPFTRTIMVTVFVVIASFGFWKMLQP